MLNKYRKKTCCLSLSSPDQLEPEVVSPHCQGQPLVSDRQRLRGQLTQLETELPENFHQRHLGLHQGESSPDTVSWTLPKWHVGHLHYLVPVMLPLREDRVCDL